MNLKEAKKLPDKHLDERSNVYEDISCPLAVEDFVEWLYGQECRIFSKNEIQKLDGKRVVLNK